jgi:hypothetical protein
MSNYLLTGASLIRDVRKSRITSSTFREPVIILIDLKNIIGYQKKDFLGQACIWQADNLAQKGEENS